MCSVCCVVKLKLTSLLQFTEIKILSFYIKHKKTRIKNASLNNSHRNQTNRIFYQKIFKLIKRSLHPTGRMPLITLCL